MTWHKIYQGNSVFQTPEDWCAYELPHTDSRSMCRTSTGSSQMRFQHWEENWIQALIHIPEAISNWQLLPMEKSVFSNGISLGIQPTLEGSHMPSSRWPINNDSTVFLNTFYIIKLCLDMFYLTFLLPVYYRFWFGAFLGFVCVPVCLLETERSHGVGWMRR